LPAREVAYYYVDIPDNTSGWRISLANTSGESALYVNKEFLPTSDTSAGSSYSPVSRSELTKLQKDGDEHFTLLPESSQDFLEPGRYYLMVVSEGQNPVDNHIGTGSSSAILTSHGLPVFHDLGLISLGESVNLQGDFEAGEVDLVRFELPTQTPAVSIQLSDRVGNPEFGLKYTSPHFPNHAQYGVFSGEYPDRDGIRTTVSNAPAGYYYLSIVDPGYGSDLGDASYTVTVSSLVPPSLNFAPSQNGNGQSHTASGILADDERAFFAFEVPELLDGEQPLGWRLTLDALAGEPEMRVRPALLPEGSGTSESLTHWISESIVVAPPQVIPGTWYLEIKGVGASEFVLTSEAVSLERETWDMLQPGAPSTTPGLTAPFFADTGVDSSGSPLPNDQGVDLENGHYHFYAIDVAAGNGGLLRAQLEAISGNPDLYVRQGQIPTLSHLSHPSDIPRYALYDYLLDDSSQTEYGNFVPRDGKLESELTPGRWYLAVRAAGDTNARYRLRLSIGSMTGLDLATGLANNQLLAAGDWRYYRVEVPEDAPAEWTVTFHQQQGDVDLYLRDAIPPGSALDHYHTGGINLYDRDWQSDYKSSQYADNYPDAGSYVFSPPLVRPGSVYYLGFKARADSVFDLSSSASAATIGLPTELAFQNGVADFTLAPGERRDYRVIVPAMGRRWVHTSKRSENVELRLEQGSLPASESVAHYSDSYVDGDLTQDLTGWPWIPGQTYYLAFINQGPESKTVHFEMAGESGDTWATWAATNGFPTNPADALGDADQNGIVDLLDYALLTPDPGTIPITPRGRMENDQFQFHFYLPENGRYDLVYLVEASTSLSPGSWTELARKEGDANWSGTSSLQEWSVGNGSQEVQVSYPQETTSQPTAFIRLRVEFLD
ncbi:hypothetical protein JIN78_14425, partial [Roseibacillus ishigakijimensis]